MYAQPVKTWYAHIFIGLRDQDSALVSPLSAVEDVCREFVDQVKLCVTVTPTKFIYVGGGEPGAIVGLINYPRFPEDESDLEDKAWALAQRLKTTLSQKRVSIQFPDKTVMLGDVE